jgi:hypothetical protein
MLKTSLYSLLDRVSRGASAAAPVQCRRSRATTVVAKAALQALIFDCDGKCKIVMSARAQLHPMRLGSQALQEGSCAAQPNCG